MHNPTTPLGSQKKQKTQEHAFLRSSTPSLSLVPAEGTNVLSCSVLLFCLTGEDESQLKVDILFGESPPFS